MNEKEVFKEENKPNEEIDNYESHKKNEILRLENELKDLIKKKENITASNEYSQLLELRDKKREVDTKIKEINDGVQIDFLIFRRPFKKYKRNVKQYEKIIEAYEIDPLNALLEDSELKIVEVLRRISESIGRGELHLKGKNAQKFMEKINMMNQQYFKGIIEEYNQKMKDKEIIEDDINKNNLRKDIDKIDQEQDFIKSEIDRMKRELESEKKVTKKLKPCPKCGKEIPVDWTYHKECGWEEIKEEESAEIVGKCKIEVFTSPRCPHCHPALDLAKQIEKERDDVKVIELNTATPHGSRKARQLSIMAVPTIFVKGPSYPQDIGFRGLPSKKGLLKAIDISLGKAEWEEKKGFLKSIAEKIPIKIKW